MESPLNAANEAHMYPDTVRTLDEKRAYHLTREALQESQDEHVRRTRKENPETIFTHYFNSVKQRELHQHRAAFAGYLQSLSTQDADVQKEAIQGIVHAWKDTLPSQLITIIGQLSEIVNQKWYGSQQHEAALLGVVDEIAYSAYKRNDNTAISLLNSILNPYNRIGFGTKILDYVASKAYAEAAKNTQRELQYLPALRA
jgi:hypothetical protein